MIASVVSAQKQQVQKRATAPRPTGNTVVRASAARAAGRAAAAAATRKSASAASERKALTLLQDLADAIGRIADADPAVAAAV